MSYYSTNTPLLSIISLEKSFGEHHLFTIPSIDIFDGDKIALIGENGCGKTTLLKILAGEINGDSGYIIPYCDTAYIPQPSISTTASSTTPLESDISGKQFHTWNINESNGYSGGEQMRFSIASAISKQAPLLFADEPTTNLDLKGIKRLEHTLKSYLGAVVLVSHERALIDSVCTKLWIIDNGKLRVFSGSYSDWGRQQKQEREFALFEYNQYQTTKKQLLEKSKNTKQTAGKMRKPPRRMGHSEWMLYKGIATQQQKHVESHAKALDKRLEHLEKNKKEKPKALPDVFMKFETNTRIRAKYALRISNFTAHFSNKVLLHMTRTLQKHLHSGYY